MASSSSHQRQNHATKAKIVEWDWSEGAFRRVHKGQYAAGDRIGQHCVSKVFKSGSVFEADYFKHDLAVVEKSAEIVEQFNRALDVQIQVNIPQVWEFTLNEEKNLVEPYIKNFRKFNSNTGWNDSESAWPRIMQALSHFSYHVTGGAFVLCDLQGGLYKDGAILTDPVLLSRDRRFGPTDLGPHGISTFFAHHRCNEYCSATWTQPRSRACYYEATAGTTMEHVATASPLSRQSRYY